jgi:hypothetical protein
VSPEAQRIAIAQSLGMTDIKEDTIEDVDFDTRSVSVWSYLMGTMPDGRRRAVPQYTEDLNAIRGVLLLCSTEATRDEFILQLCAICRQDPHDRMIFAWPIVTASPTQWCEAYLRALNLWKD